MFEENKEEKARMKELEKIMKEMNVNENYISDIMKEYGINREQAMETIYRGRLNYEATKEYFLNDEILSSYLDMDAMEAAEKKGEFRTLYFKQNIR